MAIVDRLARTEFAGRRVLVVVDTLSKWANLKRKEENDAGAMGKAMLPLQELAQEHDLAVIALMHQGKGSSEDDDEDISDVGRGSSAIVGDADIVLHLKRPRHRQAGERRVRILCRGRPRRRYP